ncbi:hydrogen gas-evolving membrane-bound hydrogenase subunit E [Hydrogenophaga sp.]|uniref:hydrogen gas-evolving membrane-bound hydrogenase subunit E n=1 Tax=Hydrogenophaga sp. TaxID=1904254 RepID=UPI0025BC5605|nr:hydrogen gas-evolving membrane-bound hydrogenase subunit E [Hydrogenophaga sp.]
MAHASDSHPPSGGLSWLGCAAFTAVPALAFGLVVWLLLTQPLPLIWHQEWVPALGVDWSFRVDGLSMLMLLMITGIGTAVFVYAGGYLAGHPQQVRLYVLLVLFMLAMIGTVTADNLIVLFLFWEMTSLTSFMLVGFNHEQPNSRKSAQQALLVTGGGGLFMLAGFIVLGQAMDSWSMSEIVARLPHTAATPALTVALLLILVGAFTKSAQFPFHFWLPNAMTAPTPVSAYLHSATMVKLGVYLLARLDPGFGEWPLWQWLLQGVGSLTAAWGMVLALRERDLKRILAWSTVATLGTLVMLVGLRGQGAGLAVATLLLAHALYKAPLFFVAGNIDHGTGTRVIDRLGNLRHAMPWTAAAALLAGLSMAGLPLSMGYIAKDMILAAEAAGYALVFVKAANIVFGAITVAVAGVAAVRVFWRHPGTNITPLDAHEGGLSLFGPPLLLALLGILLGMFPFVVNDLVAQVSHVMSPTAQTAALGLALNLGPALASLALALGIGALIYFAWDPLHRLLARLDVPFERFGMAAQYERALKGLVRSAAASTRLFQNGSLPDYGLWVCASVGLALLALLLSGQGQWVWPAWDTPSPGFVGACLVIMAGALLACWVRDRLVLLLVTGLVGFGCGMLFIFVGAPDVAYTQFVVETVLVIVVASVLLKLKRQGHGKSLPEPGGRPQALAAALLLAGGITALLLLATGGVFNPVLTDYFAVTSVPEAHGRNVVNVILVDFRALDTLGEIAVVMLSFLAAWPLLQTLRAARNNAAAAKEGA